MRLINIFTSKQDTMSVAPFYFWMRKAVFFGLTASAFLIAFLPFNASAVGLNTLGGSTYIGGDDYEVVQDVVIDSSGNVIVVGQTWSANFPTTVGAYDTLVPSIGEPDIFISKFTPDLKTLLASTFIGGTSYDAAAKVKIHPNGSIVVLGVSNSTNYPTSLTAYDKTFGGYQDFVVSIFSADLKNLLASTYLGGSLYDVASDMVIASTGEIYVTGMSSSNNYPVVTGSYDTIFNGTYDNVVISKLSANLSTLLASTYLGVGFEGGAAGIGLDSSGYVYISGVTASPNFPIVNGYDASHNGYKDIFIAKMNSNLQSLVASTFVGGGDNEQNPMMYVEGGYVYLTASTFSNDFPVTSGTFSNPTHKGQTNIVVVKLPLSLSSLSASTFLGGGETDYPYAIGTDSLGRVFIAGYTYSKNFQTTPGAYNTLFNGTIDGFVTILSSDLTNTLYSTYFGGYGYEQVWGATYKNSKLYIVGQTGSSKDFGFPITSGAYDSVFKADEGFIAYFDGIDSGTPVSNFVEFEMPFNSVEKDGYVDITVPASLPEKFNSNFVENTTQLSYWLTPVLRINGVNSTMLRFSTNEISVGNYQLTIKNYDGETLAKSTNSLNIVAPVVVYKLNTNKTSVPTGSNVDISVYPGLYAYPYLNSGVYKLRWVSSNGYSFTPAILNGPFPEDGFSLFLTYTYSTSGMRVGDYHVQLVEARSAKILAETNVKVVYPLR